MTRYVLTAVAFAAVAAYAAGVVPPAPKPFVPKSALEPAAPPAEGDDEEPAKTADRIAQNTKAAADKLADRDTGADLRQKQKQTLDDLDKLIRKAENPPPMANQSQGGGGGGGGSSSSPSGGGMSKSGGQSGGAGRQRGGRSGSRRSGQDRQPGGGQQQPMGGGQPQPMGGTGQQPMPGGADPTGGSGKQQAGGTPDPKGSRGGQPNGGRGGPTGLPFDEPDVKEIWGQLRGMTRQQMPQYFKEKFMPRYGELLRQYYESLAEKEKNRK